MSREKPREIAVRILQRRERGEDFVENIAEKELASANLSPQDRGLAIELAYGCVRNMRALDFLIDRKTQGRQQKPVLRILLRLGLYQLFFLERVPEHAAVHETVELAKHLGFGPQAGFINAVLRGYLRESNSEVRSSGFSPQSADTSQARPTQLTSDPSTDTCCPAFRRLPILRDLQTTNPAVAYSHPDWLYQRWEKRWGAENARTLLKLNNTPPPVFARANTLRGTIDDLTRAWQNEGVDFKTRQFDFNTSGRTGVPSGRTGAPSGRTGASPVAPGASPGAILAFELLNHPPLTTLPSFQKGLFYIQDPSTLLAPKELAARAGETILDMCAAPGGKTTYIAQLTSNQSTIVAEDIQPARLGLAKENADRLGAKIQIGLAAADRKFDRILIDAPCSNTGVLRRRVDLRWRVKETEITRLAATQLNLLTRAAARLKPTGTILYSTCSLEPEENQSVIQKFLAMNPDFRLDLERELIPFRDGVDGAYIARLTRAQ